MDVIFSEGGETSLNEVGQEVEVKDASGNVSGFTKQVDGTAKWVDVALQVELGPDPIV